MCELENNNTWTTAQRASAAQCYIMLLAPKWHVHRERPRGLGWRDAMLLETALERTVSLEPDPESICAAGNQTTHHVRWGVSSMRFCHCCETPATGDHLVVVGIDSHSPISG